MSDTPRVCQSPIHPLARPVRVAFQGERGAYGDLAIERLWGSRVERVSRDDFPGVVHAVTSGAADYAVLPIHNSITGVVPLAREALAGSCLTVARHIEVPIRHCVLGVPGSALGELRSVFSHSVALGQCTRFIAERRLVAHPLYDTAGAARYIATRGRRSEGAIASEECAGRYGLTVLARAVSDREDNVTRFAVLSPAVRKAG